jgi:hypothetical protein
VIVGREENKTIQKMERRGDEIRAEGCRYEAERAQVGALAAAARWSRQN